MKGKYGGPMTVENLFQALYQDKEFFISNGITHVRQTFLYFTPCDGAGNVRVITDNLGRPVDGFESSGGYASAADAYEKLTLEPQRILRTSK